MTQSNRNSELHSVLAAKLAATQSLAQALHAAVALFAAPDAENLCQHVAQLEACCSTLRAHDARLAALRRAGVTDAASLNSNEIQQTLTSLQETQAEVRRMNRVFACLVERSRRASAVWQNFIDAAAAPVYSAPATRVPYSAGRI